MTSIGDLPRPRRPALRSSNCSAPSRHAKLYTWAQADPAVQVEALTRLPGVPRHA